MPQAQGRRRTGQEHPGRVRRAPGALPGDQRSGGGEMNYYRLEPLDTLFFGDGSPFNAGETGQMEVEGTFPPSPTTVVGALRAAFARE
ncbi:MAG: type III-B CRISPR module-associated Cmr3 family protein, partial [Actinomycetota bacterium]